ncbi:MAG: SpoIIE family protein phosphatase [Leptospira sp.]|nr:SpoIIE family protein phosphatase [Leptospira sp.]
MKIWNCLIAFINPLIFILSIFPIYSQEGFQIQNIQNLDEVVDLDTLDLEVQSNSYYLTEEDLEPEIFKTPDNWEAFSKFQWQVYKVPGTINSENITPENGKFFRISKWIQLPDNWKAPHISIRLGIISDKDRVYWNGTLIGSTGDFKNNSAEAYDKIRIYKIPTSLLIPGKVNNLFIEIKPYFEKDSGINQDKVEIGPSEILQRSLLRDEYIKIMLLMVYATVGFYFLFLFIRRRKESENLFFALFTFSLVTYQFLRNQIKYDLNLSFHTMKTMEYLVLMFMIPFMTHFLRKYFDKHYNIFLKVADLILACSFIAILVVQDIKFYNSINNFIVQPTWIIYIINVFFILISYSIKKDLDAILMLGGFIFLIAAAFLDVLSTRNYIVIPRMSGYAFMTLILSISIILANRFVRLNSQVEELNENLELKVTKRTEELNNTLDEVQKLKVQQDGDYFLTSLLLNPLSTNSAESDSINIQFFTKQKKTFEFKEKTHEIGGDISISSSINLKGKKFTVFINGDAMGKSIQGAGGALVLGVVFNAVLARSNADQNKNKHPEIWIKETFIELQRIFESFNGSMLISIVLGVIDEQTGFMYYINAEHPWTVLFRDGKSSFLENELVLRKLGFPDNDEHFYVKTFQLRNEDVLLIGSDGRDDIQLGLDSEGRRIINENEELFLELVEESEANLATLVSKIESRGEYTDDITLVRIKYSNDNDQINLDFDSLSKEKLEKGKELIRLGKLEDSIQVLEEVLLQESPQKDIVLSLLGQTQFKLKNWNLAITYLMEALESKPSNTELLFYTSYSAKMIHNYKLASECGERCFIRDPMNIKNIINLADVYKKLDQGNRAKFLVNKVLKIEPNNRNALRLKEILN